MVGPVGRQASQAVFRPSSHSRLGLRGETLNTVGTQDESGDSRALWSLRSWTRPCSSSFLFLQGALRSSCSYEYAQGSPDASSSLAVSGSEKRLSCLVIRHYCLTVDLNAPCAFLCIFMKPRYFQGWAGQSAVERTFALRCFVCRLWYLVQCGADAGGRCIVTSTDGVTNAELALGGAAELSRRRSANGVLSSIYILVHIRLITIITRAYATFCREDSIGQSRPFLLTPCLKPHSAHSSRLLGTTRYQYLAED